MSLFYSVQIIVICYVIVVLLSTDHCHLLCHCCSFQYRSLSFVMALYSVQLLLFNSVQIIAILYIHVTVVVLSTDHCHLLYIRVIVFSTQYRSLSSDIYTCHCCSTQYRSLSYVVSLFYSVQIIDICYKYVIVVLLSTDRCHLICHCYCHFRFHSCFWTGNMLVERKKLQECITLEN